MVCHDESTKDGLAARVPTLAAWEGLRLKLVGLDALPIYRSVVAWFPGPALVGERYLLRLRKLNQDLETKYWKVYERREESNGLWREVGPETQRGTLALCCRSTLLRLWYGGLAVRRPAPRGN